MAMFSVIKTDKLLLFNTKNLLFLEWIVEKSDLITNNILKSSDFQLGLGIPSRLELKGNGERTPCFFFYNTKYVGNGQFMTVICDKNNVPFYTTSSTIDPFKHPIDLLLIEWKGLSLAQYPITISCTIKTPALTKVNSIQENNSRYSDEVKELCSDFKNFLEQESNTDIVLAVDKEIMKAHKMVLEARSPVFREMFTNDSSEASENKVVIADIAPETIKRFLKFLYTAEMEKCTCDELLELYYTADKYEVLSLRNCCRRELLNSIDAGNACSMFTLANRHSDDDLKKGVVVFVSANFKSVVDEEAFSKLNNEEVTLLMRLCGPEINKK